MSSLSSSRRESLWPHFTRKTPSLTFLSRNHWFSFERTIKRGTQHIFSNFLLPSCQLIGEPRLQMFNVHISCMIIHTQDPGIQVHLTSPLESFGSYSFRRTYTHRRYVSPRFKPDFVPRDFPYTLFASAIALPITAHKLRGNVRAIIYCSFFP